MSVPANVGRLLLAAVLAGAAGPALAQPDEPAKPAAAPPRDLGAELWRGARLGMSPADVTALFPKVTAASGEALGSGARSALTLATTLGGAAAKAQFYFDANDDLVSVIVDRPDVVAHKTDDNLAKAYQVADELIAEHGRPKSCAEQRRVADLICTWPLGGAKAVLSYRDVGGASPVLSVTYRKFNDEKPWAPGPVRRLKPR